MDEMKNHRFLLKRGDVFYFRRVVPHDVVAQLGKVIQFSLLTKDREEAKKLVAIRTVEFDARVDAARRSPAASASDPRIIALDLHDTARLIREYVEARTNSFVDQAKNISKLPADQRAAHRNEIDFELSIAQDPDDDRMHQWVSSALRRLLAPQADWVRDTIPNEYEIADLMQRALIEVSRRQLAQLDNDHSRAFFDPAFDPKKRPALHFGELVKQYVAMRADEGEINKLSSKRIAKIRAHAARVEEIVGSDILVSEIDFDLCQRVRTTLARLPTNRQLRFGDASVSDAVKSAQRRGTRTLSALTQSDYLSCFKDIVALAVRKGLLNSDPSLDMRPILQDRISGREKRQAFDEGQLIAFFTSTFYRTSGQGGRSEKYHDWRFWLPLLACFMGMRPNEICQLFVTDVKATAAGTPYLHVIETQEDDGPHVKTIKTKNSRRRIPVHPELVKIGFLDFARSARLANAKGALFPMLTPDRHGNMATYALKRFNEKFLDEGMTRRSRQSFYSFRHSFRDALRRIEASDDVLKALGAWEGRRATHDNYGSDWDNPDHYLHWISKVAFPGIDLSYLYGSWTAPEPEQKLGSGVIGEGLL